MAESASGSAERAAHRCRQPSPVEYLVVLVGNDTRTSVARESPLEVHSDDDVLEAMPAWDHAKCVASHRRPAGCQ